MKRELNEIIEEIKNIKKEVILKNVLDCTLEEYNNYNKENREDLDYSVENSRKNAINFITDKYNQLDKKDFSTDRDYEIADFKTFEQFFGIIKDEEEKEKIDTELNNKLEKFMNKLSYLKEN